MLLNGGTPDPAARVLFAIGTLCVTAGGLVAAVTTPLGLAHGSWLAAYLVLVAGVGQCAMGAARLLLPHADSAVVRGWVQVGAWNTGSVLVIAGTLASLPIAVDLGGVACMVALAIALVHARRLPDTWRRTYGALLVVLLVSVPVGLVLTHLRATS